MRQCLLLFVLTVVAFFPAMMAIASSSDQQQLQCHYQSFGTYIIKKCGGEAGGTANCCNTPGKGVNNTGNGGGTLPQLGEPITPPSGYEAALQATKNAVAALIAKVDAAFGNLPPPASVSGSVCDALTQREGLCVMPCDGSTGGAPAPGNTTCQGGTVGAGCGPLPTLRSGYITYTCTSGDNTAGLNAAFSSGHDVQIASSGTCEVDGQVNTPDNINVQCQQGVVFNMPSTSPDYLGFNVTMAGGGGSFSNCTLEGPNANATASTIGYTGGNGPFLMGIQQPFGSTAVQNYTVTDNNFIGDYGQAAIELSYVNNDLVDYNSFSKCGLYGAATVGTHNTTVAYNYSTDCSMGMENNSAAEGTGGDVFNGNVVNFGIGNGLWNTGIDGYGLHNCSAMYVTACQSDSGVLDGSGDTAENNTINGQGNCIGFIEGGNCSPGPQLANNSCIDGCLDWPACTSSCAPAPTTSTTTQQASSNPCGGAASPNITPITEPAGAYVLPSSVCGEANGNADFQAALNAAAGGTLWIPAGCTVNVNDSQRVLIPSNITIACGQGATLHDTDPFTCSGGVAIYAPSGTSNITVEGCTINGNYNPSQAAQVQAEAAAGGCPYYISGGNDPLVFGQVTNLTFTDNLVTDLWAGEGVAFTWDTNATISNNVFANNYGVGLQVGQCHNCNVTNNYSVDSYWDLEDAGPSSGINSGVWSGNTFACVNGIGDAVGGQNAYYNGKCNSLCLWAGGAGCSGPGCTAGEYSGVTYENNTITGNGAVLLNGGLGVVFNNNTFTNGGRTCP